MITVRGRVISLALLLQPTQSPAVRASSCAMGAPHILFTLVFNEQPVSSNTVMHSRVTFISYLWSSTAQIYVWKICFKTAFTASRVWGLSAVRSLARSSALSCTGVPSIPRDLRDSCCTAADCVPARVACHVACLSAAGDLGWTVWSVPGRSASV